MTATSYPNTCPACARSITGRCLQHSWTVATAGASGTSTLLWTDSDGKVHQIGPQPDSGNPPVTFTPTAVTTAPAQHPSLCPVCGGRGSVPAGFYATHIATTGSTNAEPCRTCHASGVLWR